MKKRLIRVREEDAAALAILGREIWEEHYTSILGPERDGVTPQPEIPVKVVYEDAFAVVLEKPPQLAVHPTLNRA